MEPTVDVEFSECVRKCKVCIYFYVVLGIFAGDGSKLHFDCSEIKALDMIIQVNSKSKAINASKST